MEGVWVLSNPDPLAAYRSGSLEPWSADVLCAVLRAKRPSVVIETGTFMGLTTARLVEAALSFSAERECRVYTVEMDEARAQEAWTNLQHCGANLTLGHGDAIRFLREFEGEADIIFLDDDHTAAHVREEIRLALKILRPGGVIFVHDVVGHFGLGNVVKEYGGVVLDLPRLHAAGGLGIICR